MNKFIKNGLLVGTFLMSANIACFAGTNLEFALKLAKDGYPELAKKYLEQEPAKSDPNTEGRNKAFGEIALQMAKAAPDLKSRTEFIKEASRYFKLTKQTPIESADFSFSLANLIKMALKEPGLSDAQKSAIGSEAIPFFDDAKTQYKAYSDANLKPFEEFMEKLTGDGASRFIPSREGQAGIKDIYSPYVVSRMRYFESVVEKINLLPKGDASRCAGLDKIIEEADAFGYLVEAPVPTVTIATYVARMYGILADCGANAKESLEKAQEKFKEVLAAENNNAADRGIIRSVKAKAINGMIEMALRSSDYNSAIEAIEVFLDPRAAIMPSGYKFDIDDFEVLLNGIIVNANAFKAANEVKDKEKFKRNIDKYKLHLEKAIPQSNSVGFWKKKLNSFVTESSIIMGVEISDPLIFLQLADEKKNDGKFEDAIPLYEKCLSGKLIGTDRITKKPGAYYYLAFCNYKLEKFAQGSKAMRDFFVEFPPTDTKYKVSLKDQYVLSSKLFHNLASKVYFASKTDEDKDIMMKSLDILELYHPEGVIFIKIGALVSAGSYIDAIKLADTVKKDSIDFDKALYFKGLSQFNYSKEEKTKNKDAHTELSLKLAQDAKATFQELINFIKTDGSDITQDKKEARKIWEKDAKKLIAFTLLSLEDHKAACEALIALNEEYKKNPEDKKSSNRLYVLQGLFSTFSKLNNAEKEIEPKQAYIFKCDGVYKELVDLDVNAYKTSDPKKTAEDRKKDIGNNYNMVIGMMMVSNPKKDGKLTTEGADRIKAATVGKKIDNIDLFLARKFLDLKDYENANICLVKVLKEYDVKGWSSPLKPDDFLPIKNKLISDESRGFFKKNFEDYAFPPKDAAGQESKNNTRDYARLMRNLEYAMADGPIIKTDKVEEPEEKALREKIQAVMKKEPWIAIKASGDLEKLKKKLYEFLVYLGIVDDLALCNMNTNQFDEAIKYLEILRTNYPGILTEDLKLADLKFKYGQFLLEKKDEKGTAQIIEAMKMYNDLRDKKQRDTGSSFYIDVNEKRLICLVLIYKTTQDKEKLEQVIRALQILYSNPEVYGKYINLFAVLEGLGLLPADLKPLTPEEIRLKNEANLAKDLEDQKKAMDAKDEIDMKLLLKRKNHIVGTDVSFLMIEMRDIDTAKFDLFKSYYEKVQGATPLKAEAETRDLINAFNLLLRSPILYKSLPPELNRTDPVIAALIKTIDEYIVTQGSKGAEGTSQTISSNRKLLEACFPQLPKVEGN